MNIVDSVQLGPADVRNRKNAMEARLNQMKMFVGLRIVATAAQRSALLSLVSSSPEPRSRESNSRTRRPWESMVEAGRPPVVRGCCIQCHGQLYRAIMVIVDSMELENVRVEQNHCHGLTTVKRRTINDETVFFP